jgi:hypothetical protein
MLSLNATSVTWSFGPSASRNLRCLYVLHRRRHAAADVDGHDELEGGAGRLKTGDRPRLTVFENPKTIPRQPFHEAPAVGDDHVDLDDLDAHGFRVAEALRPDVRDDAAARSKPAHSAHRVLDDLRTRVPRALRPIRGHHAHLTAVGEEGDIRQLSDGPRRLDHDLQHDRTTQVRLGGRRNEAQRRFGLCAGSHRHGSHERDCQRDTSPHASHCWLDETGRSGPMAVSDAM